MTEWEAAGWVGIGQRGQGGNDAGIAPLPRSGTLEREKHDEAHRATCAGLIQQFNRSRESQ